MTLLSSHGCRAARLPPSRPPIAGESWDAIQHHDHLRPGVRAESPSQPRRSAGDLAGARNFWPRVCSPRLGFALSDGKERSGMAGNCAQKSPAPMVDVAHVRAIIERASIPAGGVVCQGRRKSCLARPCLMRSIWICSPAILALRTGSVVSLPRRLRFTTHA